MTDDRFSDRVYRLVIAGDELPDDVARHARTCPACQAATVAAQDFLAQLDQASSALAAGDMPDLRPISGARGPGDPRWSRPLFLSGAVVLAAFIAVALTLRHAPLVGPMPSLSAGPSATSGAPASPPVVASAASSQTQPPALSTLAAVRRGPITCANIAQGWAVEIPAGWWYSAGIDPCRYLDPSPFDLTLNGVGRDTAIELNLFPNDIATFDRILSREELTLAGYPTTRWEMEVPDAVLSGQAAQRLYQYVVHLGVTPEAGPNFVATVSSAHATEYGAAKARLDELMTTWRQLKSQLIVRLDLLGELSGYEPSLDATVTADGRVVWLEQQSGRLLVRRLTADGLARLRKEMLQTGLFGADASYFKVPRPGISPPGRGAGAWSFLVLNDRGTLVHVVAGAIDPDETDYWIITPQRQALNDLQAHLLDPEAWLPAGAWAEPASKPYESDLTSLVLFTEPDAGLVPGRDIAELGWPLADPEHFGTSADDPNVHKLGTVRCEVLPAQDAAIVVEQLRALGELDVYPSAMGAQLAWAARNGSVLVGMTPVRPDGSPTCSQVHG